jgi:hypothetical protein
MRHTQGQYLSIQHAYNWFNRSLFDNQLPDVLVTLQRSKVAYGYFWARQYENREDDTQILDEIALNPESMKERTDTQILSTLVHEMVHCWQQHYGEPSRNGYHNQQWASVMIAIGLIPSDTGAEGGRQTGQKMSHYIAKGGFFASSCAQWLKRNPKGIQWQAVSYDTTGVVDGGDTDTGGDGGSDREKTRAKKRASKTKYSCPTCGTNAWAKPGVKLYCGTDHGRHGDAPLRSLMVAEED